MSLKRVISPGKPALIALAVLAAVTLMNPLPATAAGKESPSLPTLMASFDQGVNLIASAQHYTQRQRSLLATVERQAQRLVGDLGTIHGHLAATQNGLDLLATQSTSKTQEGEQLLVEYTRQQGRMKLIQQSLADDRALLEGVRKSVQALEKTTAPLRGDIERQLTARALSRLKEASYQLQTLRENQLDSAIRSRLEHTLLAGMVGRSETFAHEIVSASQECREIQAALNQQRTEINQLTDRLAALRSGFDQSVSVFAEVVEGFMESQSALLKSALELGPTAADLEAMPLREPNSTKHR